MPGDRCFWAWGSVWINLLTASRPQIWSNEWRRGKRVVSKQAMKLKICILSGIIFFKPGKQLEDFFNRAKKKQTEIISCETSNQPHTFVTHYYLTGCNCPRDRSDSSEKTSKVCAKMNKPLVAALVRQEQDTLGLLELAARSEQSRGQAQPNRLRWLPVPFALVKHSPLPSFLLMS